MKLLIFLGMMMASLSTFAQTMQICYGDQGVDVEAPYILTVNQLQENQAHLMTEEFLSSQITSLFNVLNFDPAVVFVLGVNPHVSTSNDGIIDNEAIDRLVRLEVAAILKKYLIDANSYSIDCNGIVTGLPRAGGMN